MDDQRELLAERVALLRAAGKASRTVTKSRRASRVVRMSRARRGR